ncbi:hypothetical protein PQO03_02470 [Lentisphaera profundi]|uniref:Zinc ribbon domain-containing protein n=1 Tax=Lentisphaera profundi TaxID=1658616 RepID=A0ABY7VRK2_9BACT|nr:hypothetical protein [Lentisphaera profundi]WDE96825.1 hypothetical protein PQO03_02470 [Lentisphaera profundi]
MNCGTCGRPVSLKDGSCYYCRDIPQAAESDLKLMLLEMERKEEKEKSGNGIYLATRALSFFLGLALAIIAITNVFETKFLLFICALVFIFNAWVLENGYMKSTVFCIFVSGVTSIYTLSLGVDFLRGDKQNFSIAFFAVFISILTAMPAILMIFHTEMEKRRK